MMNHERREVLHALRNASRHGENANGKRWMVVKVKNKLWVVIDKMKERAFIIENPRPMVWEVEERKFAYNCHTFQEVIV